MELLLRFLLICGGFAIGMILRSPSLDGIPLRYLAINVGNAQLIAECWENKLCEKNVASNIRAYIATYKPDVILLAEIYAMEQLFGTLAGGPVLPPGYEGLCHQSINRNTGKVVSWNASESSHEHECIAWRPDRLSFIEGSTDSVFGRNDDIGKELCNYDFTAFKLSLTLEKTINISFIAVHPNSMFEECRTFEIAEYWKTLAVDPNTVIGADWNCGLSCYFGVCTSTADQLQIPSNFQINYSIGRYWDLYVDKSNEEPTAVYLKGYSYGWLDHTFSNFGGPCVDCGKYYNTSDLPLGAAIGGYRGMPRADGGEGCDHRQVLVDMWLTNENTNYRAEY